MRHGWRSSSSGVRTPVRLSVQGPPGEVPATAPFSIPLHHRHRRWPGGVSRPRIFIHVHETLAHKNVATDTAHLQQRPPSLVPPAAGRRISSSYSSSACLRKRNRTRVSRAAAGCAAAAVRRQKPPVRAPTRRSDQYVVPCHRCHPNPARGLPYRLLEFTARGP